MTADDRGTPALWQWPLSIRREAELTYLGLPERLTPGADHRSHGSTTLEEVAGDGWLQKVLSTLLPSGVVWGWWTRSDVVRAAKLRPQRAQEVVRIQELQAVVVKTLCFRRMTLAIIPPLPAEQERVLYWAGQDTEQVPDVLFAARAGDVEWRTAELLDRSVRGAWRAEPEASLVAVERVLILADGGLHCALTTDAAASAIDRVSALAAAWKVEIASGAQDHAW